MMLVWSNGRPRVLSPEGDFEVLRTRRWTWYKHKAGGDDTRVLFKDKLGWVVAIFDKLGRQMGASVRGPSESTMTAMFCEDS